MDITEHEITIHTNEAYAITFNPLTHEVTTTENPDGNLMLHVRPKAEVGDDI